MMQVLQTKSLHLLETLVSTLEQYEELQKRPRYFAKEQKNPEAAEGSDNDNNLDAQENDAVKPSEKFKELSLELLDMGLYTSQKGLKKLQETRPYEVTD
jgi:hypothetical protein